jgi:hypothetical protein
MRHFLRPPFLSIHATTRVHRPFGVAELGVRFIMALLRRFIIIHRLKLGACLDDELGFCEFAGGFEDGFDELREVLIAVIETEFHFL